MRGCSALLSHLWNADSTFCPFRGGGYMCNKANPNFGKGHALICGSAGIGWMVRRESEEHAADYVNVCVCVRACTHTLIVSFLLRYHKVKRRLFNASTGQGLSWNKVLYLLHPGVEVCTRLLPQDLHPLPPSPADAQSCSQHDHLSFVVIKI